MDLAVPYNQGPDGNLTGIITDGDLRRALEKGTNILECTARELMSRNPKRINRSELAASALQRMEEYSITTLFVFENNADPGPVGVIHLHDLLKAGIA
jgi:arabinose-5-phosphate isomerase